jgi:hypothetical protein
MHAGPDGVLQMSVSDILAQAPLLLSMLLSKEKNMGSIPLVPYVINMKPQANGDVVIQVQW